MESPPADLESVCDVWISASREQRHAEMKQDQMETQNQLERGQMSPRVLKCPKGDFLNLPGRLKTRGLSFQTLFQRCCCMITRM